MTVLDHVVMFGFAEGHVTPLGNYSNRKQISKLIYSYLSQLIFNKEKSFYFDLAKHLLQGVQLFTVSKVTTCTFYPDCDSFSNPVLANTTVMLSNTDGH